MRQAARQQGVYNRKSLAAVGAMRLDQAKAVWAISAEASTVAAAAVEEAPQVRRARIERPRPNWSEQSLEQGKLILPSPRLRLNIWSRETGRTRYTILHLVPVYHIAVSQIK